MSRADEWHIKVQSATKRRFKANAALHGLTLGENLERLLTLDELGEGGSATGMGAGATPRTTEGRAGVAGLRVDEEPQTGAVRNQKRPTPESEAA